MTDAVPDIELLEPADWEVLRATRLHALQESPDTYTSTYYLEAKWDERRWRQLLTAGTWVVAVEQRHVIGIAGLVPDRAVPSSLYVESVWVAPGHRRRGVLRSLIHALAETARGF